MMAPVGSPRSIHRVLPSIRGLLLAVVAAVATALPVRALDPLTRCADFGFAEWNTNHGLPYTAVRAAFQDSRGYIWLLTRGGVARFDGVRFTSYTHENTPALIDDDVYSIADDGTGTLWLATNRGIVWHRDGRWWHPGELAALESAPVRWIERDQATMWIATTTALFTFRDGRLAPAPLPADVKFEALRAVVRAARDEMVILAEPSWHIQGGTARPITDGSGAWRTWIYCAIHHPERGWWIGSDSGLFSLRDGIATPIPTIDGTAIPTVRSMLIDRDDTLWIGTRGEMYRRARGRIEMVERAGVDSIGNFLCLLEDREGNLWGGTDAGLVRFSDVKVSNITREDGLGGRSVVSVLKARDGTLWAGVWGGGLTHLTSDGRVLRTYRASDGLPSDGVRNLCEAPDGTIWISFLNESLVSLRDGVFTRVDQPPLTANRAHDLACDRTSALWISTFDHGLARLRDGVVSSVPVPDGVHAAALLIDRQDRLWISWRGGFGRLDPESGGWLEHHPVSGRGTVPVAMLEGDDGAIWVIREGMTIQRLLNGRVHTVEMPSRVGRLTYSALLHEGSLWVNFRNGITRIPVAEFEAAASGAKAEPAFDFLREADGMRSVAPNVYTGSGATVADDGRLYFATSRALTVIDPARIRRQATPPEVIIEEVMVDKERHTVAELAALEPGRGEVEITFTALALANAHLNQFRHRLTPLEREWSEPGPVRTAYYGGLPPGNYVFEVLAGNADGTWTTIPTSIAFRLPPHYYQTAWFYGLLAVGTVVGAWGFVRQREGGLRALNLQLESAIATRTAELSDANAQLQGQVAVTRQKASELADSEEKIRRMNEDLERRVRARTAELEQANRELAAAVKEMEAFSYSVSHDLRAPLRGIDGWSMAVIEDFGDRLPPEAHAHLQRVRGESQRLGRLIDELLQLSRMTRAELRPRLVDLSAVAASAAARMTQDRPDVHVQFVCQPGIAVVADPILIEAALHNLLDNAWKFSAGRAQPRVEFGLVATERGPAAYVRDNGAGFDMRHAKRLFGAFQRLHGPGEFPGNGIGLAAVHRIIQRHGGRIWADSTPGEQTTFYFQLPGLAATSDTRQAEPAAPQPSHGST